jgi:acyl-CoA dehydrogenase
MWDFSTEPDFQEKLDWIKDFVTREVEPLDLVFNKFCQPYDVTDAKAVAAVKPLQEEVKRQGLWAPHMGPHLGGQGFGMVKLALINEILGRTQWGPRVFGSQAPDSGNAEILAMYGTEAQKARYLQPLLDGDIVSCFSMTEPQGGSDPGVFTTTAVRDGDDWVINGEKWFSSNACWASFLVVMAITDPEAPLKDRFSMFLVPIETPGVEIVRHVGMFNEPLYLGAGNESYVRYTDVRVSQDAMLGPLGNGFTAAQDRLSGGRLHHAMRSVGACQKLLDMMCERAVSRQTVRGPLSSKQSVQLQIADTAMEVQQFRLMVLHAAWLMDQGDHKKAYTAIGMAKALTAKTYRELSVRAMHMHGALGLTNELPLGHMFVEAMIMGIADGPTETHKMNVAKRILRDYAPQDPCFPSTHIPTRQPAARDKLAQYL